MKRNAYCTSEQEGPWEGAAEGHTYQTSQNKQLKEILEKVAIVRNMVFMMFKNRMVGILKMQAHNTHIDTGIIAIHL